jgi:hypothetical protein
LPLPLSLLLLSPEESELLESLLLVSDELDDVVSVDVVSEEL